MRTVATLVLGSALLVLAIGSIAQSAPESTATIQQCAKLLPKGKAYTFSLVGSIDTNAADKQSEGAAFAHCVGKLVR